MSFSDRNLLLHGILAGALALQAGCSNSSGAARRLQASDVVGSSGNIAQALFRSTAGAAIRQPVTTTRLGLAVLWHRPREIISGNLPGDPFQPPVLAEVPGTAEFEKLLDHRHFPRAESGSLKWLVDGSGFFPELDRQIASATRSIDFQTFIFDNDDIGVRYADALKRRSAEVPVRVLCDDLGSTFAHLEPPATLGPRGFVPPSDMVSYLRADSQTLARRIRDPWLVCDHTKLLVFDQHTAILGGMNIGREYFSEWHDLMVKVQGPVVQTLCREFNRAWRKAGPWGDLALLRKPAIFRQPKPVTDGIPLRVFRTDPAEGRYDILDATLLAIRGARQRIWIENPYVAHDDIVAAVAAAARRGVDVRVILPARGDSTIMAAGNLASANTLIRAGAKVFQFPAMAHLKVLICDNWACVGSANLDTLSMRINRELNLAFSHPATVQGLANLIFAPDFRRSRPLRLSETADIANSLAETLADQL
ncbi:MAG: phosphatidylserine/phosphatidylglycerophosphate/cardiolipin synthase family protein [Akkermansiaceae bacterium]|nr:phosphatidylserine/phosphatidylglycerophosphate/cardiolipin synthase family protein [Akkermansiaceae bacterium]